LSVSVPPSLHLRLYTEDEVEEQLRKLRSGDTDIIHREDASEGSEGGGESSPKRARLDLSPDRDLTSSTVKTPERVSRTAVGVKVTLERDSLSCILGFRNTAERLKCEQYLSTADLSVRPVSIIKLSSIS
jgi:hypothetical protein